MMCYSPDFIQPDPAQRLIRLKDFKRGPPRIHREALGAKPCRTIGSIGHDASGHALQLLTHMRVIQAGELGRVSHVQIDCSPGTRRPAGWRTNLDVSGLGSVNNIAVHIYDVLRFLLDQEVTEVSAMFDVGRAREMEVLPMVLLRFDGGAMAYANGNQSSFRPLNELVVYGDKGRLDGQGLTRPETEGDLRVVTEEGETLRFALNRATATFMVEGSQTGPRLTFDDAPAGDY